LTSSLIHVLNITFDGIIVLFKVRVHVV